MGGIDHCRLVRQLRRKICEPFHGVMLACVFFIVHVMLIGYVDWSRWTDVGGLKEKRM